MRTKLHSPSALVGGLLVSCLFAVFAFAAPGQAAPKYEYKIVTDPSETDIRGLAAEGYEYVGYLGRNVRGSQNDDILWRRAK